MSPTPQPRTLGSRYVLARIQSYTALVLSKSVLFPFVISRAVSLTMPSVGIRSVGAVNDLSVAASSLAVTFLDQSTARSWVLSRLVSSTIGASAPSANSAYSMTAPYLGSVARRMTTALPAQLFSIDC